MFMEESWLWFFAIVPILSAVAVVDSCTRLSVRISQRLKIADAVWIHLVILIVTFVGYVAWFFITFPHFGAIVDYVDVAAYARAHAFRIWMIELLRHLDPLLLLAGVVAALAVAMMQKRNIVPSVLAAMLGNIGTVIWIASTRVTRETVRAS